MFNQGITMQGMEGPHMSGTWINPLNGHKFTVRDCFFQDGQFMVQTTKGQILDYNTIQNYVQCTDEKGKELPKVTESIKLDNSSSNKNVDNLPKEILDMIVLDDTDDDSELLRIPRSFGNDIVIDEPRIVKKPEQKSPEELMIEKVLSSKELPVITYNIEWPELPVEQIKTLVEVLGVSPEHILEYYIKNINIDIFGFNKFLENWFKDSLELGHMFLSPENDDDTKVVGVINLEQPIEVAPETTPKKSKAKKSKNNASNK